MSKKLQHQQKFIKIINKSKFVDLETGILKYIEWFKNS